LSTLNEPFVFPGQVEQAFFLDVEKWPGWRVVCHREPRQTRIIADKMVFSLNDHGAFDNPLIVNQEVIRVGADMIPVTSVVVQSDSRDDLVASDDDRINGWRLLIRLL
jgi:hypothetical protein